MAATIPTTEPAAIVAGDTLRWKKYHPDYMPADGWVLSYAFVNESGLITVTGTDNGDGYHLVEVAAATTAAYTAGEYTWQCLATNAGTSERVTLGSGYLTIKPDYATQSSGYDGRSDAQFILDAVTAVLRGKASQDQASYSFNGRALSRYTFADLREIRDEMRAEVNSERAANRIERGMGGGGLIRVRF